MIDPMSPASRRLGLALLVAATALGSTGCSADGRHLRSPYPRGSECERSVRRHVKDLGVERSQFLHREWCVGSRSQIVHTSWSNEPCCR